MLYINNYPEAKELLDGRGAIYSDRPYFEMASGLCVLPLHSYQGRINL